MRKLVVFGGLLMAGSGVVAVAIQGCASVSCDETETCAPSSTSDGSTDGMGGDHQLTDGQKDGPGKEGGNGDAGDGGGDGDTGPTCDLSQAPSKNNCVLQDGNGFFVAPKPYGNDMTGNGTIEAPYATISKAVSQITASSTHRVYVCNATYSDQIPVSTGVAIFGGLSCGLPDAGAGVEAGADGGTGSEKWAYVPGTLAQVNGTSPDFVLQVTSVTDVVDIEDMAFSAPNATTAGQSSVAAVVIGSTKVSMLRTTLAAGTGMDGGSGSIGGTGTPTPATLTGNDATSMAAGPECSISCSTGGVSTGGSGGTLTSSGNGADGTVAQSTQVPSGATGAGGTESACSATTPTGGVNGSGAFPVVASDGPGAPAGALSSTGWLPGSGQVGVSGAPGQGGGGGGSVLGGWGGGGGCGGCGGIGGGFGMGGGASIALLSYNSPVKLGSCVLTTSTAGNGGTGASGGPGEMGGTGGNRSGSGCNGGNGGTGSQGGAGGGGAGGISVGVLYSGSASAPTLSGTMSITPGAAGTFGQGGDPGVNDGSAGVSAMTQDATKL
jgi:hypothetical protein